MTNEHHDELIAYSRQVAAAAQIIKNLQQHIGRTESLRDCVSALALLEMEFIEQDLRSLCVPPPHNVIEFLHAQPA